MSQNICCNSKEVQQKVHKYPDMQSLLDHQNSERTTVHCQYKPDKEYLLQTVLILCHLKQKETLI